MFISVEQKNNVTSVNIGFPMTIEDKIDLIRKSANIDISRESILASFDALQWVLSLYGEMRKADSSYWWRKDKK